MKTTTTLLLAIVVVLVVGAAAAAVFLKGGSQSSTSSSSSTTSTGSSVESASSSSSGPFTVSYDQLIVGYQGGFWQLGLQANAGKPISGLIVTLATPVQTLMCTGFEPGLGFSNCIASGPGKYVFTEPAGGAFAGNSTFTGFATGAGPGSAIVGKSYPITVSAQFADGTNYNETLTVQATSAG